MNRSIDKKSKKCANPWYKFLAIFVIAVLTLSAIWGFKLRSKDTLTILEKTFSSKEKENEYVDNVLIASSGVSLKSNVAVQLETCRSFIIVSPVTEKYISFSNSSSSYDINMVNKFIKKYNVVAVITGTMNLETYQILNYSHLEIYTGVVGSGSDALTRYSRHELNESNDLNRKKKLSLESAVDLIKTKIL